MNFSLLAERTAVDFLSNPWIICSVIVLIFGIALAMLSKNLAITCTKKPKEEVKETRTYKLLVLASLILISVGLVLLIIGTAIMTRLFA